MENKFSKKGFSKNSNKAQYSNSEMNREPKIGSELAKFWEETIEERLGMWKMSKKTKKKRGHNRGLTF